jgi:hypothetical protein
LTSTRTVDLISYTIAALRPTPRLVEAASGSGELCGSTFLDREFHAWLRRRFAGFHSWDDAHYEYAMERWESEIKPNFTGDIGKLYRIRALGMPDAHHLGIRDGKLEISGRQVKEIFEEVIGKILSLVNRQIAEAGRKSDVKAVLLAGGFGRNEYLKKRIQEAVGNNVTVEKIGKDW